MKITMGSIALFPALCLLVLTACGPNSESVSSGASGDPTAPSTLTSVRGDTDEAQANDCPLTQEGFSTLSAHGQNGTTGGAAGETVSVSSLEALEEYATAEEPYVIRVDGAITFVPKGKEIRVASDKTIIGVGTGGEIVGGGFFLAEGVHNVIIRNLTIRDSFVEGDWDGKENDFDGVQLDTAHHIWIDHNHFTRLGDGMIDSRKDTTNVTVSWNIFSDHNKTFGVGWTGNTTAELTIHHNWFRDVNQRNPVVDNAIRAHLYNNFMQRIGGYGNHSRGGTHMVLENSVFEEVRDPHFYDDGSLVAKGNSYSNVTGRQRTSNNDYSNWNPNDYYEYELNEAEYVATLLEECAGPLEELGQE